MFPLEMSLLAAVAATALSASQAAPVLITSYQSLGVDPVTASKVGDGFRLGTNRPGLVAMAAEESDKTGRAAVMCGEDSACLATVGQRSGAKYVLAYGIGKVGSSLLVSALFIDVTGGREITRASKRVLDTAPDWGLVTRELSDLVVKPPAEPLVVQVPVPVPVPQKSHKWRTPALISLGIAVAFGLGSTTFGLLALGNYGTLQTAAAAGDAGKYSTAVANQKGLNGGADALWIVGIAAVAVAVVFFILDAREQPVVFDTGPLPPPPAEAP
jgi:hypothetical protein